MRKEQQASRHNTLDKPLPPPPLFAFAEFEGIDQFDTFDDIRIAQPQLQLRSCPVSPIVGRIPSIQHAEQLKRANTGAVAVELEDSFSSFVASSPLVFKESILGGMKPSDKSLEDRRKRRSMGMGPRLPVKVSSPPSLTDGSSSSGSASPMGVRALRMHGGSSVVSRSPSDGSSVSVGTRLSFNPVVLLVINVKHGTRIRAC